MLELNTFNSSMHACHRANTPSQLASLSPVSDIAVRTAFQAVSYKLGIVPTSFHPSITKYSIVSSYLPEDCHLFIELQQKATT